MVLRAFVLLAHSHHTEIDAVHSPFYFLGYRPTFMDAPANPDHPDMDWSARTFLAEAPTVLASSELRPLTGFAWGYRLRGGTVTRLLGPRPSDHEDWEAVRVSYAREHPELDLEPLPRPPGSS